MNTHKIKILNCDLDNYSKIQILEEFHSGILIPVNVDMLIKMQKDEEFYMCCKNATFAINDSQIIRFSTKLLGNPITETISGSDFFPLFYMYHKNNEDVKIFLLGAKEGIGKKAMEKINTKVGRSIVVEAYSPPFGFENNLVECKKIIEIINESNATVLAIGLGAPKQEKWVFKYKNKLTKIKRVLCVGPTIDFEAGVISRAPIFIRSIGFEWLYRLYKEPMRLWKRYLIDDVPFIKLVLYQKFGKYKNPFKEYSI